MGIFIRPTILSQRIYAFFDGVRTSSSLSKLCLDLLSEQKKTWLDLREGYESLKDVRERDIPCRGFSTRLQYNPARIKSSLADMGEKNRSNRQCFLCLDHLPEDQKGVLYRNEFLILCNPMPVFSSHFTVSHLDHRTQAVAEHINIFLQLMADFGSGWTILYNGAKCGASAPDHLHFQAGPSEQMPIEKDIREGKRLSLMRQAENVFLYRMRHLGREVIILEGNDPMAVGDAFKSFMDSLKKVLLLNEEPMMNIAGFYEGTKWRLLIFPRRKHRPEAFFKDGNDRIIVSPGVFEMAGLLITPVERDFERLDGAAVESIYEEVSLDGKTVVRAIEATGIME